MKSIKLFIAATLLLTINSYGQLDKAIWLVGGTGSFNSYKQDETFMLQYNGENIKIRRDIKEFEFSPKVGFFIIDKLVIGLSSSFTSEKSESTTIIGNASGGYSKSHKFSIGPFARYYFLKKDMPYNILAEANYQFGNVSVNDQSDANGTLNKFSFLVGPEIFFNSSVGMEVLLGYKTSNQKMETNYPSLQKSGIQVAVGFQIHLEKL